MSLVNIFSILNILTLIYINKIVHKISSAYVKMALNYPCLLLPQPKIERQCLKFV